MTKEELAALKELFDAGHICSPCQEDMNEGWAPCDTCMRAVGGRRLVAEVEQLTVIANESNAVCACLCPVNEHENYGEEGESCENPNHECVRTSHAVANILAARKADIERLTERVQDLELSLSLADDALAEEYPK